MAEIPLPYTANPIQLFFTDIFLFFRVSLSPPGLFGIVWPLRLWAASGQPREVDDLDELALGLGNAWALIVHFVLFLTQFIVVIAAIWSICSIAVPTPLYFAGLFGFVKANQWICRVFLSGPPGRTFYAGQEYASKPNKSGEHIISKEHPEERWVFINGVAVGTHWMNSNLVRLSKTFRRPILGIQNPTYGIVFDVLETIVQRSFGYATLDIRTAYSTISALLRDYKVKKLVLIAHSQGCVEAGMVLDWLYATLSREQVAKLEVYTFGNAANHWNCPEDGHGKRVIQHVEHYANRHDWVARFGVIHFRGLGDTRKPGFVQRAMGLLQKVATGRVEAVIQNRFVGKLFIRDASGHLLNQHYLDNMFPIKKGAREEMEVDDNAEYMNMEVDSALFYKHNTVAARIAGIGGEVDKVSDRSDNSSCVASGAFKVERESRLWQYRNGQVP